MTAQGHERLLGILFLIQAGLSLVTNLALLVVLAGMGLYLTLGTSASEARAISFGTMIAGIVLVVLVVTFSVLFLVTGWKLCRGQRQVRVVGIIASTLSLVTFPLGTALGLYGFWFFFGEKGKQLYEGGPIDKGPPQPPKDWG